MSNPNNPGDPFNPGEDLPRYEPTNHPEDQPSFGQQGAGGYAGYQAAGNAGGPYGAPTGTFGGRPKAQVSWSEAIGYGFKAPFANAGLWILGTFLIFLVPLFLTLFLTAMTVNESPESGSMLGDLINFVAVIGSVVLSPFVLRLALHEVDKEKATWSDLKVDIHFLPTVVVSFIVGLITTAVSLLLIIPAFVPLIMSLKDLPNENETVDPQVLLGILLPFFGFLALAMLVNVFITPLLQFMTWYAASGQASIGSALKAGLRLGRSNYVQILIYGIIMGLITFFGALFTLGLGLLVLMPASYLAQAHLFRQMAGNAPVNDVR